MVPILHHIPSRLIVPLGDLGTLAAIASLEPVQEGKWQIVGTIIGAALFFAWREIKREKDVIGVRESAQKGDSKQQQEIDAGKASIVDIKVQLAEMKGQVAVVQQTMQRILELLIHAPKKP